MRYLRTGVAFVLIQFLLIYSTYAAPGEIRKKGNILYLSNTIVLKFKDFPVLKTDGNALLSNKLESFLSKLNVSETKPVFPLKANKKSDPLGKILIVSYDNDVDPFYLSSKLKNFANIEWAEPKIVYQLDFTPNDPNYSSQWNLLKILASQAWNVTKGDTSVIIGIVDTGVDWDHPDLSANIWTNKNEIPNNGIDDDQNGYIDDVHGWDFGGLTGTPDNNPMEDQPVHGTHVAGIASAVTNNGVGISSIGFKSKLLPVKATQNDQQGPDGPYILYGFEGIVYAADNGAKVINCSWGGDGYSLLAQETINYATSVGALVVAAAGNSGTNNNQYPSAYDNVLSVASTTQSDTKSSFSTYGTSVDVSAPGSGIYSTYQDDTYEILSGTSMASPLTAGLAALVWSVFPSYTPLQIGEQIRVNSDDIDALNPSFAQLIGRGRINAYNAVTNRNSISVRATNVEFSDEAPGGNGDGIFLSGETITVRVRFINYLNPTSSLSISLENKNNNSTVVDGIFNAGSKNMLEEFDNFSSKFTFTLNPSIPANANLDFVLNFSDGSYSDYQWLHTIGNPSYTTQAGNDVSLTITSKGTLAFNDFPNNTQGNGFHYLDGPNLLFEGALILATSSTQVSDAARGIGTGQNTDFTVAQPFVLQVPGNIADYQGSCLFNDNAAGANKIGITTKLESFSFTDVPNNNYIILKYYFTNNTASAITNFHAGLFFDWDIIEGSGDGDITSYDNQNNLSYTYNSTGGPNTWVTTALISSNDYSFYAIDNSGTDGGLGVNDADGFTDADKWQTLSGGISKPSAGPTDISHVVGGGPFTIQPGETIDVGFVVGAGLNLTDLQTIVANARLKYPSLVLSAANPGDPLPSFKLKQNYPNPFNPSTKIEFQIAKSEFVTLKVYDVLGNEVATLVNEEKQTGNYEVNFDATKFSSGIYFYKIQAGSFTDTKKLALIK